MKQLLVCEQKDLKIFMNIRCFAVTTFIHLSQREPLLYSTFRIETFHGTNSPAQSFRFENLCVFIVSIASSTYTARVIIIIIRVHVFTKDGHRFRTTEGLSTARRTALFGWANLTSQDPFARFNLLRD